jgi:hypothetical protein
MALTGSGTQSDPYKIYTELDLVELRNHTNSWFELANNIVCTTMKTWDGGQGWNYVPGSWTGHFDGKGFYIKDFYTARVPAFMFEKISENGEFGNVIFISATFQCAVPVPTAISYEIEASSRMHDITLQSCNFISAAVGTGLFLYASGNAQVENIYVSESSFNGSGAFLFESITDNVRVNNIVMSNCRLVSISGLVGVMQWAQGSAILENISIKNGYHYQNDGTAFGVAQYLSENARVSNIDINGLTLATDPNINSDMVSAAIGYLNDNSVMENIRLKNIVINATVSIGLALYTFTDGNLAGYFEAENITINLTGPAGSVYNTVGGIAGYMSKAPTFTSVLIQNITINYANSTYKENTVGALAGYIDEVHDIENWRAFECSINGTGHVRSNQIAPFAGFIYKSTLKNCCCSGGAKTSNNFGGFAAVIQESSLEKCYCISRSEAFNISTDGCGQFAGVIYNSTLVNCFAVGQITIIADPASPPDCGGFVGVTYDSNFQNCYVATIYNRYGTVSSEGGFIGVKYDTTVGSCYWDTELSGLLTSDGGTGKTTAEMKLVSTFAGWDFNNVWMIDPAYNDGYPVLRGLPLPVSGGTYVTPGATVGSTVPVVVTQDADAIGESGATLHGNLTDAGGSGCSVWFEWGLDNTYGQITSKASLSTPGSFDMDVTNLHDGQLYHFRAVAKNGTGISYGQDKTFITLGVYSQAGFVGDDTLLLSLSDDLG